VRESDREKESERERERERERRREGGREGGGGREEREMLRVCVVCKRGADQLLSRNLKVGVCVEILNPKPQPKPQPKTQTPIPKQ